MSKRREGLIKNNQTIEDVVTYYQPQQLLLKAAEEFSEATTVIFHYLNDKAAEYHLMSEAADILIIGAALRVMLGPEKVDHAISWKLNRIESKIRTEKEGENASAKD